MTSGPQGLPHIIVRGSGENHRYKAPGGGGGDVNAREVTDRRAHAEQLILEAEDALDANLDARRLLADDLAQLHASGSFITIDSFDDQHLLALKSLDSGSQKEASRNWMLASSTMTADGRQRAVVWVRDAKRAQFLKRFEEYALEVAEGKNPKNNDLVANIGAIRRTFLGDLWTSQRDAPRSTETGWWELWLRESIDGDSTSALLVWAGRRGVRVARARLRIDGVRVIWVYAPWAALGELLSLDIPIVEIRSPQLVETFDDLSPEEHREYADDLAERLTPAPPSAPAVCLLDTGVARDHPLLYASISAVDEHTVLPGAKRDVNGHGTAMAGLSLYGAGLADMLVSAGPLVLTHRLESVKMLPPRGQTPTDPLAYGVVTAAATAQPEAIAPKRRRVFSLPITARGTVGENLATLWSASIDALAAGATIGEENGNVELLTEPSEGNGRLFVVSAGNVDAFALDHRENSARSLIEEPAQAYNVLTVGAMTDLMALPTHPDYEGWRVLAEAGDLSPHSRTSQSATRPGWPLKPDICMEGGNVLTDGAAAFESHASVSLLTTSLSTATEPRELGFANATSAATAQAARLSALVLAEHSGVWPETVRALMTHSARWTPHMVNQLRPVRDKKNSVAALLRAFGWGVPDERRLFRSFGNAATMIIEDAFVPFDDDHKATQSRIHRLPWPRDVLAQLDSELVRVRVTLSYFVEPNARRRGWKGRYSYASHALRFHLKRPTDDINEFVRRVRGEQLLGGASDDRWLVGQARDRGSLHQDIWEGTGAELAAQDAIGITAVGGWWKYNNRKDRAKQRVRYSLVVSLETDREDVDLYTPIEAEAKLLGAEVDV